MLKLSTLLYKQGVRVLRISPGKSSGMDVFNKSSKSKIIYVNLNSKANYRQVLEMQF